MNARICLLVGAGLALMSFAGRGHATIYKCLLDHGGVFYQDAPCAPGRELRDFDKDPANVSVVPFGSPATPRSGTGARPPAKPAGTRSERPTASPSQARAKKPAIRAGDPGQRKFLRPGMSEGEVVARVGEPDMTSSRNRKGTRWTYMPVPEDAHTLTHLTFEHGKLTDIERKVIR
jgi:hypothetical protein